MLLFRCSCLQRGARKVRTKIVPLGTYDRLVNFQPYRARGACAPMREIKGSDARAREKFSSLTLLLCLPPCEDAALLSHKLILYNRENHASTVATPAAAV
uniref:Uncharacterized protein n=1 Tax=Trichogramma kaykai TaxID=54128 RepID=A0ABD2WHP5_9HYME